MIDLHCHMLPGLDDGPKCIEQALAMATYALDQGIQRIVMTPHIQPGKYDNDIETIKNGYQDFKVALEAAAIPLKIEMGAEVRVCAELMEMINQEKVPFVGNWNDMRVILLEFPHDHIPLGVSKFIDWLLARNIKPLLAHPERNQAFMRRPEQGYNYIEMGCLFQITAGSITGLFGKESQKCAMHYIDQEMVTVIATDGHNLHKRKPTLLAAKEYLLPKIGLKAFNDLIMVNPARILAIEL